MEPNKAIELVFAEWIAKLKAAKPSERARKTVRPNFENLFQKWKDVGATFDELYEIWLPKAIKAHQPVPSKIRSTWKGFKSTIPGFDKSEAEFTEEWTNSIEATGTEVFFEFFPAMPVDHDPEPKVYGNMSETEYKAQRRYADQFPTLDTRDLIKKWKEQQSYNMDVEDIMENILGDKDETK